MLTGILAVRNIFQGQRNDLWEVNAEQEYHEEVHSPQKDDPLEASIHTIRHVFQRLHPVAFGLALGGVSGLYLFLATIFLIMKGGDIVGPNLSLLSQFLPGYRVTVGGSFLGMLYGLGIGFMSGWNFAKLRNGAVLLYMAGIDNQVRRQVLKHFHEYL